MGKATSSLKVESRNSANAVRLYYQMNECPISIEQTLNCKGYKWPKEISKALQGSVYQSKKNGVLYIIKTSNKSLYNKQIMYYNDERIPIKEDIVKEAHILKYLTNNDPPSFLTKFVDFFEDDTNYFLVMENGGNNLFDFVRGCHQYIVDGVLSIDKWHRICKEIMQQIVSLMDWMHNTMNCCHLDISLENFVIKDVSIIMDKKRDKILGFGNDFQVKIIDFGLAEVYSKTDANGKIDFRCNKYVGKIDYQSPEIFNKQIFDARSADCWSLSVSFFKMIVGAAPFLIPSVSDRRFSLIINGFLVLMLHSWNRMDYVTPNILDLMNKVFVTERDRLSIKDIQNHEYFSN